MQTQNEKECFGQSCKAQFHFVSVPGVMKHSEKKKKTGYMRKASSCLIEGTVHYGREIQDVEF